MESASKATLCVDVLKMAEKRQDAERGADNIFVSRLGFLHASLSCVPFHNSLGAPSLLTFKRITSLNDFGNIQKTMNASGSVNEQRCEESESKARLSG